MDAKFKMEIKDEPLESFDDKTLNNLVFAQVSGLEERIDYSSIEIKGEIDIKEDPLGIEEKNSPNENQERMDYSSIDIKGEIDIKHEPLSTEEKNSPNENQEINIKNEFEIKDEPFDDELEGRSNDQVFAQISRLDESQNMIYISDGVKDSEMKSLSRSRPQTSGMNDQNIQKNHVIGITMSPKRALWSENDLVLAVQAVERGILSTYKASERYKVPRRTIRNHLQTGSLKKTLGRKSLLSDDLETELVNRIMRFAEIGLPVTPLILRRLVFKFCELNNIKNNFNPSAKVAGKDWFKAFMKRHPEISRRKAQFMNPVRAQKLNKFIVDDHFKRLSEVYDNLDLKSHPERIYNMDEKGCRLTIHHQQTVLAKKKAIPETAFAPSLLTEAPAPPVPDDVNKKNSPPLVTPRSPTSRPSTSRIEEGIGQTPNKRTGSFYRRVYGSSSSDDDENHVPLAEIKRTVFKHLMPTPVKNTEKTPIVRRKALNYRGTPVTKDLFDKNKEEKKIIKTSNLKGRSDTKQKQVSWYCHGCEEDKMADMRQCAKCSKWYHEECVGLSADDTDTFECPDGC